MFNYQLQPGKEREILKFEETEFKPKITIITAYYNGHKYIDQTINSVLNQTFPFWEWIIVNDGSTNEESIEKLKEIEKIDKRIKVLSKENSGLAATRDFGADRSDKNAEYLLFLDDDDVIHPTYLECAYATLQTNKEASWAYTDVVNFEGMKEVPESPNIYKFEQFVFDAFSFFDNIALLQVDANREFAPIKDFNSKFNPEIAAQKYEKFVLNK